MTSVVGNDLVDLDSEVVPLHPGYTARVFTENERSWIADDAVRLWSCWAAKEAAYKALRQRFPSVLFSPNAFEYFPSEGVIAGGKRVGSVVHARARLQCYITCSPHHVHAVCHSELQPGEALREAFASIKPGINPGISVRQLLLENLPGWSNELKDGFELSPATDGRSAPTLTLRRSGAQIPLSFSHHGRFIAAVAILTSLKS